MRYDPSEDAYTRRLHRILDVVLVVGAVGGLGLLVWVVVNGG